MKSLSHFFASIVILYCPSHAAAVICSSSAQRTALLVIDMQMAFVTSERHENLPGNPEKVKLVIAHQVEAIKKAIASKIPIILIEYKFEKVDLISETDDRLKDAVGNYKDAIYFKKNADGLFEPDNWYRKEVIEYLKQSDIGTLIVMGANGGACVEKSIEEALRGNCNIVAYNKGIVDFNPDQFIYPYSIHYNEMKNYYHCESCTFREVSEIDEVARAMTQGNNSTPVISLRPERSEGTK